MSEIINQVPVTPADPTTDANKGGERKLLKKSSLLTMLVKQS